MDLIVRASVEDDRAWICELLAEAWGSPLIVTRGKAHDATALPGLIAMRRGKRIGLLTYRPEANECELVSLNSLQPNQGVGSALLREFMRTCRERGCRRVWLVTTNDNLHAMGFYQRREFRIAAVHPNAVEKSRLLKPSIPKLGMDRIPIRDEIELEAFTREEG